MNIEIKFRVSSTVEELMKKLATTLYEANREMLEKPGEEIEAIFSIRYTSKSLDGDIVLRFQKASVDYGRLVLPALSENDESEWCQERTIGPLRHTIWSIKLNDLFKISYGKGMDAVVVALDDINNLITL